MEEKKRERPTVAQVRELRRLLDEQVEGTSKLVQDCDGWRDKYRALFAEVKELRDELLAAKLKNDELSKINDSLIEVNRILREEAKGLKKKSFWKKLF